MKRSGATLDEERNARVAAMLASYQAADLPRGLLVMGDSTGHAVTMPASVVMTLCYLKAAAKTGDLDELRAALENVDAAVQMEVAALPTRAL